MYTQALYLVISKTVSISDIFVWYQWKHFPALSSDEKLPYNANDKFCSTLLSHKASPPSDAFPVPWPVREGRQLPLKCRGWLTYFDCSWSAFPPHCTLRPTSAGCFRFYRPTLLREPQLLKQSVKTDRDSVNYFTFLRTGSKGREQFVLLTVNMNVVIVPFLCDSNADKRQNKKCYW